jgi:CheY-like chemotaxis protein
MADRGQIDQVIMNLVVNARDAMPTGGRIIIETRNTRMDQEYVTRHVAGAPGPYVLLSVTDTGTGMDRQTQARIFEPFFTTKTASRGTGLGLATVYGIVKQSGGYVWVHSELNKGTSFKVYLPRADDVVGDVVGRAAALDQAPSVGNEAVLVVEDEDAVRLLTRRVLEQAKYRVFDAANPVEAEAVFDRNPNMFSLLVTDVIMPGSSGPKLFAELVRRQPNLKVLYVSGFTDAAIIDDGQMDSGAELLQKPFSANALTRRVRGILDGE